MNARHRGHRGSPLIRAPKKMPRMLAPEEVVALTAALRTMRDQAMVSLMVHAGLRRCEVLGLRFADIHIGDRTGGGSSPTARAATSAWSLSCPASSSYSPPTSPTNAPPTLAAARTITSSWS